ncbi:hypothetical protein BY996DRAFT_7232575 [Phakopsora pachyrhizi]|nr:hypothetical protein BY996DRAFT_7232575 [Phakopsora pachyrhizi]
MIGAPEIESEILNITAAPCSNIKFSTPVRNFDNQGGFPAGGRGLNGRTERTRKPKTPYPTLPSRPKIERSNSTTDLFSKELQSNQQNSKLTLSETNQVDSVPAMSSFEVLNRRSNSRPRPSLPETMIRGTRITAADHNDQSPESFRLNFSNFERSRFNYQRCSSFLGRSDEDEVEEDEFETDCSNDRSRQYNPVWWSNSP